MKIYIHFYIFFSTLCFSYTAGRLVFLYTHFRHGARGPTKLDDNYQDVLGEKWEGLGELTGVGERMHYLLGLRNRKKYIEQEKFLSEKFEPHEILIFTTNRNRTMISCYSQLQGLYPQRVNLGEILSMKQEEKAYPPVLDEIKGKDADIEQAINELGNYSLPYSMMLAPARMINDNEVKMGLHSIGDCVEKTDKLKENNEKIKELQDETDKFNEKYAVKLNNYYKNEKNKFTTKDVKKICGDFFCDYTENREMKEFKDKTEIDFDIFYDDCLHFYKMYYIYYYYGDEERLLAYVESSKIMRELLYYMKRRLDADITEIDEDANIKDYSRPRYIMISGHDSTVSADLTLLIKVLGLDMNTSFYFPRFASQLALEVRTNLDKCKSYSDYYIVGYFNNIELFNINAEEFMNKVEKEIWTDQQVEEYCGFYSNKIVYKSNDDKINNYKIVVIICLCLIVVLIATIIFLGIKLYKSNRSNDLIKKINETNSTMK